MTEEVTPESIPSALLKRKAMDVLFEHEGQDLNRKRLRKLTERSLNLSKGSLRARSDFDPAAIIQEFECIQRFRGDTETHSPQPISTAPSNPILPYSASLLKAVFVFLNRQSSVEGIRLKDLRRGVENDLGLPGGALKQQSNELRLILEDYNVVNRKRKERIEKGQTAYLRYSKKEEEIVLHYAQSFLRENDLGVHVINPILRGMDSKVSRGERKLAFQLYKEIAEMLPHRVMADRKKNPYGPIQKVLYYKFGRDLLTGRWTAEEKQAVESLVSVYGKKWTHIGKLMNKRAVDIKDLWRRMRGECS